MTKTFAKIIAAATFTLLISGSVLAVTAQDLLPKPEEIINFDDYPSTQVVNELPDIGLEDGIRLAIQTMLGLTMFLTIAALVVAGIYYIKSRGKEEDITKAKDIMLYLVIGIAIMAAAYGVVAGIIQFQYFE